MKPTLRLFLLGSAVLAASSSVNAATYYWDDNAAGTGFGTAGASTGTWAGPTAGPTAGWSLSSTGANAFAAFTTGTADALNLGTNTASFGLGAGTISVSGAVSAGGMTFGSQSGAITLSGGTSITMGGTTPTITVNNAQDTIGTTVLQSATGTNTGLTKAGSGELILSASGNSIAGDATPGNGVGIRLGAGTLTLSGGSLATTTAAKGLGTFSGDSGNFKQTAGTVTVNATGDLIVGWNSASTFTLSGGTTSAANIRHQDASDGTITISGTNTTTVGTVVNLTAGGGTDSLTLNLNSGGTLVTSRMYVSATTATTGSHALNINLNGGTLKASATGNLIDNPTGSNSANASVTATVKAGGAFFDTNTFTATILRSLVHDSGLGSTADGGLTKSSTGTLVLSAANTYTGATTVSAGILSLGNSLSLQNSALDTTGSIAGNATNGLRATTTTLTLGGLTGNKNFAATGGVFTSTTGGYGSVTALTLNPGTGVTNSYSGAIENGASGMTLTKTGLGTQTLAGINTYTGATLVSAGTLAVDGSLANTATTVGSTGTLQGSGTIGGTVTVQGTLAPGNSIESLGTGALSFAASSTYAFELQTNLFAGTPNLAADLTFSTGTLDIAAGALLTLSDLATSTVLADGSKLTLISYAGGWTSGELFTYNASTLADNSTITLGANQWVFDYNDSAGGPNFSANQTGATSYVTMTVVPEPSAVLLGGLGMLCLLRRRR